MTPASPIMLDLALAEFERLLAGVPADGWDGSTPCAEWTVRQLANHVVTGSTMFADILNGTEFDPAIRGTDLLGDDPAAAAHTAGQALLAAFDRDGVLEQMFTVPFGTVPGVMVQHARLIEVLVHSWDLATATGQTARFPSDLVEQELRFTQHGLSNAPAGDSPFEPPQPIAEDAPLLDQLAAVLGRRVPANS